MHVGSPSRAYTNPSAHGSSILRCNWRCAKAAVVHTGRQCLPPVTVATHQAESVYDSSGCCPAVRQHRKAAALCWRLRVSCATLAALRKVCSSGNKAELDVLPYADCTEAFI